MINRQMQQIIKIFVCIISVRMKSTKGKENSHTSNNQFIVSTYRVESDQKDLIIKALKADHNNLKKNEGEYYKLSDHYKSLQHNYKLLTDQKGNDDRQFKMRHEAAVRNIGQLKNQIDSLRVEMRDRKLEMHDLQTDSNSLKQQLDEKNIQLQSFRNDYKSCLADSQQLGAQRESLNNANSKLTSIINTVQQQHKLLKDDNDSVDSRIEQLSKYQRQLQIQESILKDKIQSFENENNELDFNATQLCDRFADLELAIKKAQDEFENLQLAVNELNLLNQRYRTEYQHIQKNIQAEVTKNNNFMKGIKSAEYTHKVRTDQANSASREVEALLLQNQSLNQINSKLTDDLQSCRAHLQNLGLINSKLVDHLQNFTEDDEGTIELINRKPRVQVSRNRLSEVQKETFYSSTSSKYKETGLGGRQYR